MTSLQGRVCPSTGSGALHKRPRCPPHGCGRTNPRIQVSHAAGETPSMPPRPPPPDVPLIDATAKSTSGTGNSIGGRDSSGNASVKVGLGQGIALLNSLLRHPAVRRKYDHMERSAMASMTEAVGDRGDAASAMADKGTQRARVCDINVQTSVHCKVAEVTGRPLAAYLALPPDDYSVLDSRLAEKLGGGRFRLALPLAALAGLQLEPRFVLSAQPDPQNTRVVFVVEDYSVGVPELDERVALRLAAVLSRERAAGATHLIAALHQSMAFQMPVKGASRLIPVPLLRSIAQPILKIIMVRFADDMLKWLVKDYENWAHGRPRVTAVDIDTALTSDDFKRGLGSISEAADEGQRMVAAGPVRHDA